MAIEKNNLNDCVRVTLTDYGRNVLAQHYRAMSQEPIDSMLSPEPLDFQLWELMHIFGQCLYHGNPRAPFEGNEIQFFARTERL